MAHINPIQSRPLSAQGRENYDRIFRKRMTIDELVATPEWMAAAAETVKAFGMDKPRHELLKDIPTELNHHI